MPNKPEKIVILGGGVSGVTAAFELTSEKNWQDKYDITLYQLGWRNGGKGASGRNRAEANRIEEHGIHVWFGFYKESFKAMSACYKELNRPANSPVSTIDEAFFPHNSTAMAQKWHNGLKEDWIIWPFGSQSTETSKTVAAHPEPIVEGMLHIMDSMINHFEHFITLNPDESKHETIIEKVDDLVEGAALHAALPLLKKIRKDISLVDIVKYLIKHPDTLAEISSYLAKIRRFLKFATKYSSKTNLGVNRFWQVMDLGLTTCIGLLTSIDKTISKNPLGMLTFLNKLNETDFREWLGLNGASKSCLNGALLDSLYSGFFAFKDGDLNQPNVETGTFLMACLYAVKNIAPIPDSDLGTNALYRMSAGMGDIVFAPYYEVLKTRGVKFKFFHEVTEIKAEKKSGLLAGNTISQIILNEQVPLKNPSEEYNPLFDVKGLPCWPSTPLYGQIQDDVAELLIKNDIDLESSWSNWPTLYDQPKVELNVNDDFDRVILNISVAGLATICPSLLKLSAKFKGMTENISTVATQAVQTWGTQTIREMGCTLFEDIDEAPECLGYTTQANDSWADVSYLVNRETWPEATAPKDISYFCGVFSPDPAPTKPNPNYPKSQKANVKDQMMTMFTDRIGLFWPKAQPEPGIFLWDMLHAPQGTQGEKRADYQYYRANIDPSERYVQSTKGTSKHRLKTDNSGFDNIYLTGDWIQNGFNMGCVESATISGLKTAKAIQKASKS